MLALGFFILNLVRIDSHAQGTASAAPEDAALGAAVESYFAVCDRKDLAGAVALWSDRSPNLAAHKQSLQQLFASEELSDGHPAISRVKVEGEKASLRATIARTSINLKSREKSEQQLIINFELVKEAGGWKVWRYALAAEDLAEALVKTGSRTERSALLTQERELVTGGLGPALLARGKQLLGRANYDQAKEIYELVVEIAEQSGDGKIMAGAVRGIGDVHRLQSDTARALEQYQKSLKISEDLGDKEGIARTLNNIGVVHYMQGDYAGVLEQFQKSLKISEELGDKVALSKTLNNIGEIYRMQGNYAEALEQYRKSLKISEETGGRADIAGTLNNIGLTHSLQGNYAEALEQYRKSLKISEETGSRAGTSLVLNNIGVVHYMQGDYAGALEQYRKSLEIREESGDRLGISDTLSSIGDVLQAQGNPTQALQFAERAIDLAQRLGVPDLLQQALTTEGKAYVALGQPGRARQSFDAAIASVETMRAQIAGGEQEQQYFFASKISPYYAMVELLIAQNNPDEALNYAERAKARVLLDVLSSGRVNITKAMTREEQEQERHLNGQLVAFNSQLYREKLRPHPDPTRLAALEEQLRRARLDFEAFQVNLYAAHPELKARRGEAPVIKAEELATLLPDPRSALLEYVVTDDHTYLFAITKAASEAGVEVRVYALPIKRADLTKQIESFRGQLAGRDLGVRAPAGRLYQLLLKPAEAQLQGKTNLIIVPDDKLWELPFQGLITGDDRYVIETSAVSYSPSLTVLREMKAQRNKHWVNEAGLTLLALGNPAIGQDTRERAALSLRGAKLVPLPEAEQEVKALGPLYGAAHSKIYIGPEAREDRVKTEAGQANVLHFATHGILNDAAPMYSHLVLARGNKNEDGLLEAWELMRLDLKARLAVLSACETARGRFGAGEGVIGLSWAMFVAGVPTTLVSQWKVESTSTRDLMINFHRQLKAPSAAAGATVMAEAWRQAALKLMKNPATSHPFYWAGFVLVGDDR